MRLKVRLWTSNMLLLLIGYVIGWIAVYQNFTGHITVPNRSCSKQKRAVVMGRVPFNLRLLKDSSLFVGVMTTHRNLATRAAAIFDTWGRIFPVFLSSTLDERETSRRVAAKRKKAKITTLPSARQHTEPVTLMGGLPVVELQGISDELYPPRDKCFAMIQHMHVNFAGQFQWFLRTDDDVYIHNEELVAYLAGVDNTGPLYIGHPGFGVPAEIGQLGLDPGKPYCIGGPGVVFSPSALKGLVPHLPECTNNTVTSHEDTELGRCVLRHLNLSCTPAKEMRKLFYQDYSKDAYADPVSEKVFSALTLHPLKDPRVMRRLHVLFQTRKLEQLREKEQQLISNTNQITKLIRENEGEKIEEVASLLVETDSSDRGSFNKRQAAEVFVDQKLTAIAHSQNEAQDVFDRSRHKSHDAIFRAVINKGAPALDKAGRESVVQKVLLEDNPVWTHATIRKKNYQTKEGTYTALRKKLMKAAADQVSAFKEKSGPSLLRPYILQAQYQSELTLLHGVQHLVSLTGSEGLQSFWISSKFKDLQWIEVEQKPHLHKLSEHIVDEKRDLDPDRGLENEVVETNGRSPWPRLSVLLPLCGRHEIFLRFLDHLSIAASRYPGDVSLRVGLYPDQDGEYNLTLEASQRETPIDIHVTLNTTRYSRSNALNSIAKDFAEDAILIIVDVDLIVTSEFLRRVAMNVSPGTAYFPIMFSKYAPETVCYGRPNCSVGLFDFSRDAGFWRHFSYGMLAITAGDFQKAGGFDSQIYGWGKEDLDFYERCLKREVVTLRAPDTGLIHLYHDKECDSALPADQLHMCRGSKHQLYGSTARLARIVSDLEPYL